MNRPVLALATTIALASAVHIAQRHLQHRHSLELAVYQAHGRMLEVATTQTDLAPIWVRNHPDHVKDDESGPLLMCQWWLEFLAHRPQSQGVYTAVRRQNARNFMEGPDSPQGVGSDPPRACPAVPGAMGPHARGLARRGVRGGRRSGPVPRVGTCSGLGPLSATTP